MQRESTLVEPTPFCFLGMETVPAAEFLAAEPDTLRDAVCLALLSLPEAERESVRNRLLADLKKAGLRVRESLLMLGVSASTVSELTPPEMAALIRYVRLAKPNIMMAVAEPVRDLLTMVNRNVPIAGRAA